MTDAEELTRAAHASAVLENPEFQAALDDIERGIVERWKSASVADEEGHRYLKLMLKIHGDYVATLKQRLSDGKMAEIKIKRKTLLERITG